MKNCFILYFSSLQCWMNLTLKNYTKKNIPINTELFLVADVLKKNDDFDSNDVILKTGYFTEGNTQSLLGQNSSETGFQLPKLTPAPGYAVEVRSTVEKMAKGQNG